MKLMETIWLGFGGETEGSQGPPEEEQSLVCSSSSGFPSYISGAVTGRTNL